MKKKTEKRPVVKESKEMIAARKLPAPVIGKTMTIKFDILPFYLTLYRLEIKSYGNGMAKAVRQKEA